MDPILGGRIPRSTSPLSIVAADQDTIEDAVLCFAEAFEGDPDEVRRKPGQTS